VITVERPVGGVQVDDHLGVVVPEQTDEGARFRRLELHMVAVQVEALGVGALPHAAHRAVLRAPIGEFDPFVAVGVVDRRHQEHQGVEPGSVLSPRQGPQQQLGGFFPFDFSGVDVGLNEDAYLAARADGRGTRVPHPADHDQRQGPPFHGVAERGRVQQPGRQRARPPDELDDVGVGAGLAVGGALGTGAQRRGTLHDGGGRQQEGHEHCDFSGRVS